MSDISNLLQDIYDILKSWFTSFGAFVVDLMTKLNLIETETANLPAIKANTDNIKDNTGAVVTPIQSIKSNSDSIKNDTTDIKNNVSAMTNQLTTISTNVGTASAFAEDVANNTLDCSNRLVTIGSDTTQIRTNSNTITSDIADIKQALGYYIANTPVTEDSEGVICNFDTDLEDYLQKAVVTIPADVGGISSIDINKFGKNLCITQNILQIGYQFYIANNSYSLYFKPGTYTIKNSGVSVNTYLRKNTDGSNTLIHGTGTNVSTFIIPTEGYYNIWFFSSDIVSSDIGNIEIEFGNTVSDISYEEYKIITDTVSLGSTITDGGELDLLSGLLKINTTPATYAQLTPIAIRTYKGVNNIYSDIGSMNVIYRETLKHYLDKNNQ